MSKKTAAASRVRGAPKDPEAARGKIVAAAIELFGRQGFRAASTETIAEMAGYSQATIFFHFNTKEGLLRACLDEAKRRVAVIEFDQPSSTCSLNVLKKMDRIFDDRTTAEFVSRMVGELTDDAELQKIYAAFHAKLRDVIAQNLMRDTGAPQIEAEFIATALLCMSIGVHTEYKIESEKYSRKDYGEMLDLVGELLMRHLRAKHGGGEAASAADAGKA